VTSTGHCQAIMCTEKFTGQHIEQYNVRGILPTILATVVRSHAGATVFSVVFELRYC